MEEQIFNIHNKLNFKYAALVTERLLASNCYQDEQTIFKKKLPSPCIYYYLIKLQFL